MKQVEANILNDDEDRIHVRSKRRMYDLADIELADWNSLGREGRQNRNSDGTSSLGRQLGIRSDLTKHGAKRIERREHGLTVVATRSQRGAKSAHPKTTAAQAKRDARWKQPTVTA